ncbi:MAG: DUF4870 domain-containing protein [Ktedonobacterales bacterium]|nr:DUF4870 domain-containing protein [Ktedonobacterales bacterium]
MYGSGTAQPIFTLALYGVGTCEVWPEVLVINGKRYPLRELAHATLVEDPAILVPPDSPPWPAVHLTLRDERTITLTPADPPDAWRLLEQLYRLLPQLRVPLPPLPGERAWQGRPSRPAYTARYGLPSAAADATASSSNEAVLAGITHLSLFFAPIILPLIIWLATRERSPYVSRQARQACFFHLFYAVLALMLVVIWLILVVATLSMRESPSSLAFAITIAPFAVVGLLALLALYECVFAILGAIHGFQGRPFSYPLLGRF